MILHQDSLTLEIPNSYLATTIFYLLYLSTLLFHQCFRNSSQPFVLISITHSLPFSKQLLVARVGHP